MQKSQFPSNGPMAHLFRDPVLPGSKESEAVVYKPEKRWETFQDFFINTFENNHLIPASVFTDVIYNHYTKEFPKSVLAKAVQTTCTESPTEYIIRRDHFRTKLALRFGTDMKKFASRIMQFCNENGHAQPWFKPYTNRREANKYMSDKNLPCVVYPYNEDSTMFVVVDKNLTHHRILFRNDYYFILTEVNDIPCHMGAAVYEMFQHNGILTAIRKVLNPTPVMYETKETSRDSSLEIYLMNQQDKIPTTVNVEISQCPVNIEILQQPMNIEILQSPVNIEIPQYPANIEIPQHPVKSSNRRAAKRRAAKRKAAPPRLYDDDAD